jgi:uncharacterized membrane protein
MFFFSVNLKFRCPAKFTVCPGPLLGRFAAFAGRARAAIHHFSRPPHSPILHFSSSRRLALIRLPRMSTSYNRIAGQSVERLAALSDGIFAVGMTLLVLDLRVPVRASIHSEHDLWRALAGLSPQLIMFMMSFLTLGIFWVGQQTQLNYLEHSHRSLAWIHLFFLFAVCIMPFSTELLAGFTAYRIALIAYWLNILILGVTLYFSWNCALELKLVKDDLPPEIPAAIQRRIVIAQSLYALGALLCIFSTYLSIAFIVLVQLNYAIALPFTRRSQPH